MITALSLLTAIKTGDWFRYTGSVDNQGYAMSGTTGENAINLRCPLPMSVTDGPLFIEYQHVGSDEWLQTGYMATMRYDASRPHEDDGDGYEFVPYRIDVLKLATG